MNIILDGRLMTDQQRAHQHIKEQFAFPDYYGNNLDALWDLLTEVRKDLTITLIHHAELIDYLDGYGQTLLDLFKEIEETNKYIVFIIEM